MPLKCKLVLLLFRFSLGILVDVLNYEMKNYWLSRQEDREFNEAAYYLCSGYDIWSEVWYLKQMKQMKQAITRYGKKGENVQSQG